MTRRNDKRNNRHNRQRNNNSEVSPFAQMIFGALLGKGADMIASVLMDKAAENDHPNDEPHTGIKKVGNHVESSVIVKNDGTATEVPIPDNLQFFFDEDGKLMVRKKIEEEAETPDDKEKKPITYDDVIQKLYYEKTAYWAGSTRIAYTITNEFSYNDINNCASEAQCKRMVAFNKLQNIAKYLNKGWKPDFTYSSNYTICKDCTGKYSFLINCTYQAGAICFKTEELAREAIRLMGEASLNDLFNEDW